MNDIEGERAMYRTISLILKNLDESSMSHIQYWMRNATLLQNEALNYIKTVHKQEGIILRYNQVYHQLKNSKYYKNLASNIAQNTLKQVDSSISSLLKNNGEIADIKVHPNKLSPLIMTASKTSQKDNGFYIPISKSYKETVKHIKPIKIPYPPIIEVNKIKEIKLISLTNGEVFEVQFVHEVAQNPQDGYKHILGIDVGVDNFIAAATERGESFLIDGKRLKHIIYQHNKKVRNYKKHPITNQDREQITKLNLKFKHQIKDYVYKSAKMTIDEAKQLEVGLILIGHNANIKSGTNIGKNNLMFQSFPYRQLRKQLKSLCELNGIEYLEREESYTSKASFFDNDPIPTYGEETEKYEFNGKRIYRGLYKSKSGLIINSDINGALNIIRKSNLIDMSILQDEGWMAHPKRLYVN